MRRHVAPALGLCVALAMAACDGSASPREPEAQPAEAPELTALRQAVERNPNDPEAHRRLAVALKDAKHRDESIRHFERAVELAPKDPRYALNLALIYTSVARFEEAERLYRRLAELPQLRHIALNNLGNLAWKRDRFEEAIALYEQAVQAKPDYVAAYYHLGVALQRVERFEEAYGMYVKVLEFGPPADPLARTSFFDSQYRLAKLDLERGETERGAQRLAQLLAAHPEHAQAHYAYAGALTAMGQPEAARRELDIHMRLMARQEATMPVATGE